MSEVNVPKQTGLSRTKAFVVKTESGVKRTFQPIITFSDVDEAVDNATESVIRFMQVRIRKAQEAGTACPYPVGRPFRVNSKGSYYQTPEEQADAAISRMTPEQALAMMQKLMEKAGLKVGQEKVGHDAAALSVARETRPGTVAPGREMVPFVVSGEVVSDEDDTIEARIKEYEQMEQSLIVRMCMDRKISLVGKSHEELCEELALDE